MTDSSAHTLDTAPLEDPLDLAVSRARLEEVLFGSASPVTVGRYVLIERAGAGGMGVVWAAWDPELGRRVALKLAASGDTALRARAREEGRALARLSHPHVVPIYDVLDTEHGVFLVMELVQGKTLRAVAAERPRSLALVRAYRDAALGLAAAHAAGLIHRDFKPDNAILGADGRVRILDFGLARLADGEAPPEVAGTPRFMAPEQRAGTALTAAVDQYALCVALEDGLRTLGAVPRWLEPVLARGRAERAGERFPTMTALAEALGRDPATVWRRRVALGGVTLGVAGVAISLALARSSDAEDPCTGGAARIDASWRAPLRGQVVARLGGLRSPYAVDVAPRLIDEVDRYTQRWVDTYDGSCRAHRRGEISPDLLDRRVGCLSRGLAALGTFGAVAATATDAELSRLVVVVHGLPAPAACEDDDALVSGVAPPAAHQVAEADAVDAVIERIHIERDAGRLAEARASAEAAVTRATALGYRPLLARALLARGRVALVAGTSDRGASDLGAALRAAIASGDDRLAIEAYARFVYAIGTTVSPERATDGLPLVEAMLEHQGERARFERALLHMNLGSVALARGDRSGARSVLEHARDEAASLAGAEAIELTSALGTLVLATDDPVRRAEVSSALVAIRQTLLGPTHPRTLEAQLQAALLLDDVHAVAPAVVRVCSELAHYHSSLTDDLGECGATASWFAAALGDRAALREATRIVLAADRATMDPHAVAVARVASALDSEPAAALAGAQELQRESAGDDAWWTRRARADGAVLEALAHAALGDRAAAARALDVAQGLYTAIASSVSAVDRAQRAAVLAAVRERTR